MKNIVMILMALCITTVAHSNELIQTKNLSKEEIKQLSCIQQTTNRCINNACVGSSPISSDRDCQQQCNNLAKEQCQ